jgi:hypothetical protein
MGSAVGIAPGYGLDDRGVGVQVPVGSIIFVCPYCSDRLWDPTSLLSSGYRGENRHRREAEHSFPTSAKVKKPWIYTSIPPYAVLN